MYVFGSEVGVVFAVGKQPCVCVSSDSFQMTERIVMKLDVSFSLPLIIHIWRPCKVL
jgi:hypothetical protein